MKGKADAVTKSCSFFSAADKDSIKPGTTFSVAIATDELTTETCTSTMDTTRRVTTDPVSTEEVSTAMAFEIIAEGMVTMVLVRFTCWQL